MNTNNCKIMRFSEQTTIKMRIGGFVSFSMILTIEKILVVRIVLDLFLVILYLSQNNVKDFKMSRESAF
jgi:hypothetical protein